MPSCHTDRVQGMRLNRYLAASGLGSRRAVEELVLAGRVTVNGLIADSPAVRIGAEDAVTVDGVAVMPQDQAYVLLHKPAGVVTTLSDPQGRRTVRDLVPHSERLFPVGRLDADTTGALVMTNDGELAHLLMHPSYEVAKTYEATLAGDVTDETVEAMRRGIELDDGMTAPARVRVLDRRAGATFLEIELHEGRNRQVKRMCEAVGHRVRALHRPRYAGLALDDLAPGQWRDLTAREIGILRRGTHG